MRVQLTLQLHMSVCGDGQPELFASKRPATYVPDLDTTPRIEPSASNSVAQYSSRLLTDIALFKYMPRHDPHFASLTDDPRTVPTNHPTLALGFQSIHDFDLIPLRYALGDGHNELDLILDSFNDGVGCEGRRDVDDGSVGFDFVHCISDGAKYR